ncbi:hypothetical protein Y032_0241g3399 [Ancylostoma ceylanicum]|uniref:Uncharacterized protein n=1 Tax=Ancylostoma ceylanicum TaxID=53326 RepID=A0A016SDV4_9BILA|nr:hypothetical protein Y032_0241g3399 [Ancylostoma ceylanicum]
MEANKCIFVKSKSETFTGNHKNREWKAAPVSKLSAYCASRPIKGSTHGKILLSNFCNILAVESHCVQLTNKYEYELGQISGRHTMSISADGMQRHQ